MTGTETFKFNVGGKLFEVSRSLIETQHADSMLGRLISKTWNEEDLNRGDTATAKTIFIDRDGDNFGHILNYLRYGQLYLPFSVSRDVVLADMDFYGIAYKDDAIGMSSVFESQNFQGGVAAVSKINQLKGDLTRERNRLVNTFERQLEALEEQRSILLFAAWCFQYYTVASSDEGDVVRVYLYRNRRKSHSTLSTAHRQLFSSPQFEEFANKLKEYANDKEQEQSNLRCLQMVNKALMIYNLKLEPKNDDQSVLKMSPL